MQFFLETGLENHHKRKGLYILKTIGNSWYSETKSQFMKDDLSFFEKAYQVARQVPRGRITSYGAIAEYLGAKGSARMVGWAMNKSFTAKTYVPAHRVVNRNGLLTGKHHFPGSKTMQQLLENEGIQVDKNKIVKFKELFWNPSKELS